MENWSLMAWGDAGWGDEFARGFAMTLLVSVIAYVLAFAFGLLGAMGKLGQSRLARLVAGVYTAVVRALPEILVVLIIYFSVAGGVEKLLKWTGLVGRDFEFSSFWAAVFAISFVAGAFMTEVLRAAMLAVPKGQIEAAVAIGMSRGRIFRRIILPQALRHAVPGLGNMWLNVTKETAIIAVIGTFSELLYTGYRAAGATKQYGFFYGVTALCFLAISLVSMVIIAQIEKRVARGYQ